MSLKDTEGPDQKVTLQAWLAGRAHLVATSHERDLDHALAEVRRDLIRQIEEERSRREPRKPEDALSHDLTRPGIRRRLASRPRGSPCSAVVTMANTADLPLDLRDTTERMLVGYERATGGMVARLGDVLAVDGG